MKSVAYLSGVVFFALAAVSLAVAQQADPALDDILNPSPSAGPTDAADAPPAGPSELDALSQGENTDFPDIETVEKRKPISVTLRALNKVTAKNSDLVINMNESARYGALEITPRFCDKRPPEEFPETSAFVEIVDKSAERRSDLKGATTAATKEAAATPAAATTDAGLKPQHALPEGMIFSGWMFKSTPALNGVEHPVYDVWVIDCKTVAVDN